MNQDVSVLLLFSSSVFITNVLANIYKQYYLYAVLFLFLTITSLIHHYDHDPYTAIVDKLVIIQIALYGGYMFYRKSAYKKPIYSGVIVFTFVSSIGLYYYGYATNAFCFHPDKSIGNRYHGLLHLISSFGHHLITFL